MPDCSSLQRSLAWCQGRPELPGVKRRIYYISKYDIVKWPTLPHDANGQLIGSAYQGDFVLRADASWKFIDIIPDKSQLTSEAQGEYPSQTQLNKLTAVHPSVGSDATAAAAYLNNNDNVFLVEDMKGAFRVVGSDKWQTKTTVTQDLGQGAAGSASTTINVEASDECPAPFYAGKIATEDGIINSEGNPNSTAGSDSSGSREHEVIGEEGDNNGGGTAGGNSSKPATYSNNVIINGSSKSVAGGFVTIEGPLTSLGFSGSNMGVITIKNGNSQSEASVASGKTSASWSGNIVGPASVKVYRRDSASEQAGESYWFTITVNATSSSTEGGNSGGNTGGNSGGTSSGNSGSDEIAYSGKNGVSYNKGVIINGTKYSVEKGGNINFSGTLKSITVTGVNVKDVRLKYTENGAEKYQQFTVDESNTSAKWTGNLKPTQTVTVRVDDGSQFQLVTLCTIDIQTA